METAVGVFSSRDTTDEAVRQLLQRGVPEQSIVFLTRSESEAKTITKEVCAYVGGFAGGATGMTAGVVAASLLLPGIVPQSAQRLPTTPKLHQPRTISVPKMPPSSARF